MNPAYVELLNTEEAWPPSVALGELLLEAPVTEPYWHDFNHFAEFLVYVTLEELAACHRYFGQFAYLAEYNQAVLITAELVLNSWLDAGSALDAYILPDALMVGGLPCAGVRYGAESHEYISPNCDSKKLLELLATYGWRKLQ